MIKTISSVELNTVCGGMQARRAIYLTMFVGCTGLAVPGMVQGWGSYGAYTVAYSVGKVFTGITGGTDLYKVIDGVLLADGGLLFSYFVYSGIKFDSPYTFTPKASSKTSSKSCACGPQPGLNQTR